MELVAGVLGHTDEGSELMTVSCCFAEGGKSDGKSVETQIQYSKVEHRGTKMAMIDLYTAFRKALSLSHRYKKSAFGASTEP